MTRAWIKPGAPAYAWAYGSWRSGTIVAAKGPTLNRLPVGGLNLVPRKPFLDGADRPKEPPVVILFAYDVAAEATA